MSTAAVCGLPIGPVPDGSDAATSFYEEGGAGGGAPPASVVSATMTDWAQLADSGLVADVVLAAEVLYHPTDAQPLVRAAASLLKDGGTLLLADPAGGRIENAQQAAAQALRDLGAVVSEVPLEAPVYCGDGYYTLRAGDGKANGASPTEAILLLRADFASPPLQL